MDYRQRPLYASGKPVEVAPEPEPVVYKATKVYMRDGNKELAVFDSYADDHIGAILEVQDSFLAGGKSYNEPVLAVINGGKA